MNIAGLLARIAAAALLLLGFSLLSQAAGPARPATDEISGGTILVTVNGEPVRRALFDELVKARTEQSNPYDEPEEPTPDKAKEMQVLDREALFEDLLNMEILAQKAKERGIHLRPEVMAEAELQYKTLLQQELVREIIAGIAIDPAEIQARYDAIKPERSYKLSHILLDSEPQAHAVIRELNKGARFQSVAQKRSLDTHTRKDGALGWMMASQLESSFVAGIEALKPGTYSQQPVQTPYGWHVVQLHGARELDKPAFETARAWLRQEILYEKVNAQLEAFKKQARIEVAKPQ